MGFRINTNVSSMNAQVNAGAVSHKLSNSIEKLSSGLRINKAADDSSGMAIADSLRSQANTLGQAIKNTNDAIGMVQIADKAMDEQTKILDTIKVKATQAAQDTQNTASRSAIQADVNRLVEQLDNIAFQTSYNGLKMLAGSFTNKEFQVGAYSNETIKSSIGATSSDKIGSIRKETTATITAATETILTFDNPTGGSAYILESVIISTGAGTGVGVLAEVINKNSNELEVRATFKTQSTGSVISAGSVGGLTINSVKIGDVSGIEDNDRTGALQNSINKYTSQTGVFASVDEKGRLNLTSNDGRGIVVSTSGNGNTIGLGNISAATTKHENYGRLTLTKLTANDIAYTADGGVLSATINSAGFNVDVNLRDVKGTFLSKEVAAAGAFANKTQSAAAATRYGVGVTTKTGAMMVMDIAESGIKMLDRIRSDVGSVQSQLEVTKSNISVTQVNVKAAESGIRDVDFASETSNFSTQNILIQSGSYALSQANSMQKNVLSLLQ